MAERVAFGRPLALDDDNQIHTAPRPATALFGRLALAAIFFVSGFAKLTDTSGTAAHMEQAGMSHADTLAVIAGICEIAGAIALATGFLTRLGALGLFLFLIPTTIIFHGFWNLEGAERMTQMVNFMKNLAIGGGLLGFVAYGAGKYSLDSVLRRPQEA
ncbi:MAG TPA: DoxX family protein [Kofleriaceae bacterium]